MSDTGYEVLYVLLSCECFFYFFRWSGSGELATPNCSNVLQLERDSASVEGATSSSFANILRSLLSLILGIVTQGCN